MDHKAKRVKRAVKALHTLGGKEIKEKKVLFIMSTYANYLISFAHHLNLNILTGERGPPGPSSGAKGDAGEKGVKGDPGPSAPTPSGPYSKQRSHLYIDS